MSIKEKKIAIFFFFFYEELELWYPYYRMIEEGASVVLIGSGTSNKYVGKKGNYPVIVDKNINEVDSKAYQLNEKLAFTLTLNYRFDSEPHGELGKTYTQIKNGIEYSF